MTMIIVVGPSRADVASPGEAIQKDLVLYRFRSRTAVSPSSLGRQLAVKSNLDGLLLSSGTQHQT